MKRQHLLGKMIQIGIEKYAVGPAFIGFAYFDLPYHLVVIKVNIRMLIEPKLEAEKEIAVGSTLEYAGL